MLFTEKEELSAKKIKDFKDGTYFPLTDAFSFMLEIKQNISLMLCSNFDLLTRFCYVNEKP